MKLGNNNTMYSVIILSIALIGAALFVATENPQSAEGPYFVSSAYPSLGFSAESDSDAVFQCELLVDGVSVYLNDSVINGTFTQALSNTSLSEGEHAWAMECSDSSGTSLNKSGTVVVDTIPPSVSILAAAENGTLYANASSGDANPYSIEVNVSDASGNLVKSASGGAFASLEVPSLPAGIYSITAVAYDAAGNAGSLVYEIEVEGAASEPLSNETQALQNETNESAGEVAENITNLTLENQSSGSNASAGNGTVPEPPVQENQSVSNESLSNVSAGNETVPEPPKNKTRRTQYGIAGISGPELQFVPPTPNDSATVNYNNITVNVSSDENLSSCGLYLNYLYDPDGLWTNISHLGIYGGMFDYNASIGLNTYSSYNMLDAKTVALGDAYTCYVLSNGNSACVGDNSYNQSINYTGGNAVSVSAKRSTTCYLLSNGNSVCYGDNTHGQATNYTGGDAIAVAEGGFNTCYLRSNGNSTCYGWNYANETTNYTGGDAIAVSTGQMATCYLLSNGNSTCYGEYYQDGPVVPSYTGGDAIGISFGYRNVCYLLSNGDGTCYGNGQAAQEYYGGNAIDVSVGYLHTCYLLANGTARCAGDNSYGQTTSYSGGDALAVFVGNSNTCYLLANGSSKCYGYNYNGQSVGYAGTDIKVPFADLGVPMTVNNADASTTANVTLFGLPDRSYSFNAKCSNATGSQNSTDTRNIMIDTANPAIELADPTTNTTAYTMLNYITVNVTASDANLNNVAIYLYNSMGLYNSTSSATSPLFINWTGLPDGFYYWNATASDIAGNSNWTEARNVTIDTTPPEISFMAPTRGSGSVVNDYYIEINVSASDASGISSISVFLFGSTGTLINSSSEASNSLFANFSVDADGNYSFNATAYDALGNYNNSETMNVTIDTIPPSLQLVPPTPDDGVTVHNSSLAVNVSSNKELGSCYLNINTTYFLWTNIRHLGIYGGIFDYNASMGVNNYSSFDILNRRTVVAGYYQTCYILSNGNSTCYGYNSNGQSTNHTGGNAIALSAGYRHACYLLSNGNSACYGNNDSGSTNPYTGGDAIAVSAGYFHTCYLRSNGNSTCYGTNTGGSTNPYTGGDAITISSGTWHTCYLLSNGNSICYGSNTSGDTNSYSGGDAIAVSAGYYHTCYLRSNGNSTCYGANNCNGQSPCIGSQGQSTSYTGGNAIAVSAGDWHTCYLLSNGNSACYGYNGDGSGEATNYAGGNAIAVSAGSYHTCYLLSNDNSTCYGYNYSGSTNPYTGGNIKIPFASLGLPMTINNAGASTLANATFHNLPEGNYAYYANCTDIAGNYNITENRTVTVELYLQISGVSSTVLAGETSARITWTTDKASNSTVNYGATTALESTASSNTTLSTSHNVTLTGLTPQTLSYYNVTSCTASGTCNTSGPYNFTTDLTLPSLDFMPPTPNNGTMVHSSNITVNVSSSKNLSSCYLRSPSLWTNIRHLGIYGGMFDYNASIGANSYSSFQMSNRMPMAIGERQSCYILANGNSTCYGSDSMGELTNYTGGDAIAAAGGQQYTCYLLSNGTSICYGDNRWGQSTSYTGGNAVAIAAGEHKACYLLSNGNSTCYGEDDAGETANHTGGNAIALAGGHIHTCYLLSNGDSACYGNNNCDGSSPCSGQSTNYTGGDAIAVAAGNLHTCYLLSNGNSICYGNSNCDGRSPCIGSQGQSTNYTGGNAIAVSGGEFDTCYLLSNGNSTCYGYNNNGQSTNYTGGNAIAVVSGWSHTCYLIYNGTSTCYGDNNNGRSTNYTGGNIKIPFAGTSLSAMFSMPMTVTNAGAGTLANATLYGLFEGNFTYYANCTDLYGNSNRTGLRTLAVELFVSISGVSSSLLTGETSARIAWTTDKSSNSTVSYGTTTALGSAASNSTLATSHNKTLTGLTPQTLYYYNVTSCTVTEICNTSGPYNFTTDLTPPSLNFMLPTPNNGSVFHDSALAINLSSNEDLGSCYLSISTPVIWSNVRHLNITGGAFDYNASIGVNNYSSSNMLNRNTIAKSLYTTCYVLSNGSSVCSTGSHSYSGSNAVSAATGGYCTNSGSYCIIDHRHTCYLLSNGNSQCYGENSKGQATSYTGGNAIAVSAANQHTCYLLSNGNSVCYGDNSSGISTSYGGGDAIAVSAGNPTCYLLSNGNSVCYGSDSNGQADSYDGGDAIAVAAGNPTCYVLSNGNSVCYGSGGAAATSYTGGDAIAVAREYYSTCYLLSNGNSTCYESSNYTGGNAIAISGGDYGICYLLSNGNSTCSVSTNYYGNGNIQIPFTRLRNTQIPFPSIYQMTANSAGANTSANATLYGLSEGNYSYYANCADMLNNTNRTGTRAVALEYAISIYNVSSTVLAGYASASIAWNTSKYSNSSVDYGITADMGNAASNGALSASHSIILANLTPHSTYYYNVTSCTALGTCNVSGPYELDMNTTPSIGFVSPTPSSNSYLSRDYTVVNVSVQDTNFANVTVYFYNQTGLLYANASTSQSYSITYADLAEGIYYFNATAFNTEGVSNSTETRNVTIDTVYPAIQFTPPTLDSGTITNHTTITMNVSSTENLSSCRIGINVTGMWNSNRNTISAKYRHTCYVLSNGNSTCYGDTTCEGSQPCIGSQGQSTSHTGGDAVAVSAGYYHTCYLLNNGNSTCYGDNGNNESTNYTGGDAMAVSAGGSFTCYLRSNGNSTCYGLNGDGQSTNYTGGDAIAISAGYGYTCYLLSNGNSTCYGSNSDGQSTNYTGGDAIAVAAGPSHTCYLRSNGNSICYGWNSSGQTNSYTGGNAIAASAGLYHTCYILSNGHSTCYGFNPEGQSNNYTGGNAIATASGESYTCYLLSNGNSTCYGYGISGSANPYTGGNIKMQFGSDRYLSLNNAGADTWAITTIYNIQDGTYSYNVSCADFAGNSNATETRNLSVELFLRIYNISTGTPSGETSEHITWTTDKGSNSTLDYGNTTDLGNESSNDTFSASHSILITGLTPQTTYYYNVSSCTPRGVCNTSGPYPFLTNALPALQFILPTLGNSTVIHYRDMTVNISSSENVTSCRIDVNATWALWTNISHLGIYGGRFDYNASTGINNYSSLNMNNRKTIASGDFHTCYVLGNGNSTCYGDNTNGRATNYTGGNAIADAAGSAHTCYLLSNGNSTCYGSNTYKQATNYTRGDAIGIAAGAYHTCYLLANGNSTCYGLNTFNQSTNYSGFDAVAVSAGLYHTCYLLSNGNSVCYGNNTYGQSASYTGGDAIAASAGYYHTCYLLSNGNSTCYGDGTCNGSGGSICNNQSASYAGGDAIAVSTGAYHTCYLRSNGNSVCYGTDGRKFSGGYVQAPSCQCSINIYYGTGFCTCTSWSHPTAGGDGRNTSYTGGNAIAISAGAYHTCYLLSNGNSTCYGVYNFTYTNSYGMYYYSSISVSNYTNGNIKFPFADLSDMSLNISNADAGTTASIPLYNVSEGSYSYSVNCTDESGGTNRTELRTFTVELSLLLYNVSARVLEGDTTALVTWTSDKGSNSTMEYGNTTALGTAAYNSTSSVSHSIFLTGVVPNTLYYFNISSCTPGGTCNSSGNYTFISDHTPPALKFTPPTPDNGSATPINGISVLVNASEDLASCSLYISNSSLWTNIRHLGISGGRFDYNASIGVNNYSSFNMLNRNPIAVGYFFTCYLLSNGNSTCYGTAGYNGGNAIALSAGGSHICYLLSNGNSTCYGDNGNNESTNYTGGDAIAVSAGSGFTCYLLSNSNSTCYGNSNCNSNTPCIGSQGQATSYTGGDAIAISAAGQSSHTCYLLNNGNSTCYGSNDYNQSTGYTGGNAIAISAGNSFTCYLLSNGNSTCYGAYKADGYTDTSVPNYTYGDAIAVAAGTNQVCYLLANGTSRCLGRNNAGEATNYRGGDALAVASGNARTCYLLASGNSKCYGSNYLGNTNPYTGGDIMMPFQVSNFPLGITNDRENTQAAVIMSGFADSKYTYYANCSDLAGNTNVTEQRKVIIDTTNPAIRFVSPADNSTTFYTRTNIVENASASDANLANVTVYLYNSTGLLNYSISLSDRAFANFTNLSDGRYYINATAYDIAGNSNSTEKRRILIDYDRTPPRISFIAVTDNSSTTKNVKYINANVSAIDNQSGVAGINAYLYSGSNLVASASSNSSPLNSTFSRLLNGLYRLNATAHDVNGNLNRTETRNITIDRNLTVLILIPSPGGAYSSSTVSLNYIVGGHSTPTACWYYVDNGSMRAIPGCANTTFSVASEGAHCVYVYANGTNHASDNDTSCFTVSVPSQSQGAGLQAKSLSASSSVSCVRHSVGDVSVYVRDNSGNPVPGASVSISGSSGSFSTDSSGRATIRGMADGAYSISASASGYYATSASADVSCASLHTLDVIPSIDCGRSPSDGASVSVSVLYDSTPEQGVQVTLAGTSDAGSPVSLSESTGGNGKAKFSKVANGTYTATASFLSVDGSSAVSVSCGYAKPVSNETNRTVTGGQPAGGQNGTGPVAENASGRGVLPVNKTESNATSNALNATQGLTITSVVESTAAATRDIMGGMIIFATSPATAPLAIGIIVVAAAFGYVVVFKPGLLPFMRK